VTKQTKQRYPKGDAAAWNLSLIDSDPTAVDALKRRVEASAEHAQYGWGHTVDFGPFTQEGLLGDKFRRLVGVIDELGWMPEDLTGLNVADVGCYTGGIAALFASRGGNVVAIDELASHTDQCALLAEVFGLSNLTTLTDSLYNLEQHFESGSFEIVFSGGVLYHLSDMLVGLMVARRLLKPGGTLVIETNAVENMEESYANFSRFFGGSWWQPTGLAVADMLEYSGFSDVEVRFYQPGRCVAVGKATREIEFRRGVNLAFDELTDARPRPLDPGIMAPARDWSADAGMLTRYFSKAVSRLLRLPMRIGYWLRHRD